MTEESPVPNGMQILVIVSRPLDLDDLPHLADQWALQSSLRRVQAPAYLKMLRPPTIDALQAEILNGYDIVHFDGHGDFGRRCPNCGGLNGPEQNKCERCECLLENQKASGYFSFEREDGLLDALAAEELAEIVNSPPENAPKLVFLSACESAKGGEASLQNVMLKSGVPAVLGMNEPVPFAATVALAGPFYASLGAGMTIDKAFKNALPALRRLENGSKLQKIPVLYGPGKDAKILQAKATGKASFEAERLFGLPEQEFVGDYIRADPPRGRKGLLSQTMDALQSGEKLVALTGQGGIGKTVLAAEAARRLAWRYPGGIFWRSAADMKDLDLDKLLNAFENIFGPQLRSLPLDQKRDTVLNYLRNYDTASLLVVDNAESIKDDKLWRFLEGIPHPSAVLVTTRESLPREGKEIRIPEMEPGEATRLLWLEARRRSNRWGEHLSPEDKECLNEIAGVMKGHPLAIKLTAALLPRRSLSSIRDELRRNPPKEISERFDVSFNSLSEGQKDLFCRLAVFSSSMTEEAVGRICIESADSDWQSDLGELERMSFLDRFEIAAQDKEGNVVTIYRYKLHPLMHQYAAAKAGEALLARLRPRAAEYFLEYAQNFAKNFFLLSLEHENLLAAMDWFAASQ
jgi:predicted ATPase